MTQNKNQYKEILTQERAVVIGELKKIGVIKDEKNPDDWEAVPGDVEIQRADPNDVADKIDTYEGNTALVHEFETRLNEIDKALAKIDTEAFGICEMCNQPIEEDRLEANPAAPTCKQHMN